MSRTAEVTNDLLDKARAVGELGGHHVLHESTKVATRDGMALVTDVYHPADLQRSPVILMRTPYGRGNGRCEGVYWASHGYRLILQDCRGTASYFSEAADGADTVAWIEEAPWFDGALLLHGGSYHGFAAWAVASSRPASLRAMSVQMYSSDRVSSWYPGGTFGLDVALPWAAMQGSGRENVERDNESATQVPAKLDTASPIFDHLPLEEADVAFGGAVIPFYRERLRYDRDHPHWAPLNFSDLLPEIDVPVLLIGGWYDFHRRYIWQDYEKLRSRHGADSRLVFGPWPHAGLDQRIVLDETRRWFDDHLKGSPASGHQSLRLYVNPERGWIETSSWPPRDAVATTWYLNSDHTLEAKPERVTAVDTYVYDPADPTPAVGLSSIGEPEDAMPTDNRTLEARPDVLSYTTGRFEQPVTLAGSAHAKLFVNSTQPTTDFFVRITDVHPHGASINIADAIIRLKQPPCLGGDDPVPVDIDLGPIAHHLAPGHALRVQISSGAHPVYARNPGGTEPPASTTRLFTATQQIRLGGRHPSHITVDVRQGELETLDAQTVGLPG